MLEFLGAQQRHGRRGDSADFHHREPAGRHHRVVRRAQEHAIAGDDAELIDQHVGDAVGLLLQVGIGPAQVRRLDADAPSPAFRDMPVEQFRRAVHALGELQLRQLEQELRLRSGGGRLSRVKVSMWAEYAMNGPFKGLSADCALRRLRITLFKRQDCPRFQRENLRNLRTCP
jgi:hypothetical protein